MRYGFILSWSQYTSNMSDVYCDALGSEIEPASCWSLVAYDWWHFSMPRASCASGVFDSAQPTIGRAGTQIKYGSQVTPALLGFGHISDVCDPMGSVGLWLIKLSI